MHTDKVVQAEPPLQSQLGAATVVRADAHLVRKRGSAG
jgi:hypothetical protein